MRKYNLDGPEWEKKKAEIVWMHQEKERRYIDSIKHRQNTNATKLNELSESHLEVYNDDLKDIEKIPDIPESASDIFKEEKSDVAKSIKKSEIKKNE